MDSTPTTCPCNVSVATKFLLETRCIREEPKYCLGSGSTYYVNLNTQQIFDALVTLYTKYFQFHWLGFEGALDGVKISCDSSPEKYLALVYISTWFIDLHASNGKIIRAHRECGWNIPSSYIELRPSTVFSGYDSYLATLNAHIRPTRVKVGNVDALYVPVICNGSDFPEENPLGIEGFISNLGISCTLMGMERRRCFRTFELCGKDVLGKPSWLFDWHSNSGYAWFPQEVNYSMDDVTIACIVGAPCTPHLGPFDRDDWQYGLKTSADTKDVQRVRPQSRHGFFNVRVLETENWTIPESVRALSDLKGETNSAENPEKLASGHNETYIVTPTTIKRFRLVDYYLYYNKVFSKACDGDSRLNAWWKITAPRWFQ